jgi:membrane protein required for colicin V production
MQAYDIVMIVVLVAATIFGAWKGLAWQLASLGAIVASYVVALQFRDELAVHIKAAPPWNVFVAMLVLYVGTSLLIWIFFRMVSGFIDKLKLNEFDRQIGALFGFAKGVLLCVIITLFAVTLLGDSQREAIVQSRSGFYIARLLDKSHSVMPQEIHDVLSPYIHTLDERLQHVEAHSEPAQPVSVELPTVPVDEVLRTWNEHKTR